MIIISENELIHTDSFSDVIEHHGVKGMKWGQRMKRWGSAYSGMVKRRLRHPMLYDVARRNHRVRVGEAQKKLANAYVGLNTRYKNDINKAKANRARAFVNAGGKF